MSDHQVQIPLPLTSVRHAWSRYVDLVADSEDLGATFASLGPDVTMMVLHDSDAGTGASNAAAVADGFVAYLEPVRAELEALPGASSGTAPVGPDGTAHMPDQAEGLGSDNTDSDAADHESGQTP